MIDAHHHLWQYEPVEFAWISDDMAALRRDFLPSDFLAATNGLSLDGAVTVQARTCMEETEFLLELAERDRRILGVVGWFDLKASDIGAVFDHYASRFRLRGVREVCQGQPDDCFFDHPEFNRGISELAPRGLTYDILVFEDQLAAATRFVDRHPNQRFVIDHCGKPRIESDRPSLQWSSGIRELARQPNVWCKLSGLVTEVRPAGSEWTVASLRPYTDTVLNAFGPSRVIFGSDWPVCLLATAYARWVAAVEDLIGSLSPTERCGVMAANAVAFYGLQPGTLEK